MVAIHVLYYNFGRIHKTLRITPAMAAGLADHVWSLEEIVLRQTDTTSTLFTRRGSQAFVRTSDPCVFSILLTRGRRGTEGEAFTKSRATIRHSATITLAGGSNVRYIKASKWGPLVRNCFLGILVVCAAAARVSAQATPAPPSHWGKDSAFQIPACASSAKTAGLPRGPSARSGIESH